MDSVDSVDNDLRAFPEFVLEDYNKYRRCRVDSGIFLGTAGVWLALVPHLFIVGWGWVK